MKYLKLLGVFAFLFVVFVTPVKAEGPWYNQTPDQFKNKVMDEKNPDAIFGERYTFAQINWIINSLALIISPNDTQKFIDSFKEMINKQITGEIPSFSDYAKMGTPGIILGGISEVYKQKPASGIDSINSTLAKFDLAQPAKAAGYGFTSLSGIQLLWSASRNTAYLLMVVILIAAGFMIMFRVKINPQTVVSLQTMIPKLVITLLLVTFSYAIAGLVIDMIYVFIALFISLLNAAGVIHPTSLGNAINLFTNTHGEWLIGYFLIPWVIIFGITGAITILLSGSVVFAAIPGIIAVFSIVAVVFLVWNLVKIWWMLMRTYITLVLLIAIGPWQIMLDLIPGQQGFGPWIRNIIANASVFVVVPIMFALNMLFWKPFFGLTGIAGIQQLLDAINKNPLGNVTTGIDGSTPFPNLPFMSGNGIIFNLAIGYVILSLTPKVADMIRDALKVPAFKYGNALGEGFGPIAWGYNQLASAGSDERKFKMDQASKGPKPDLDQYKELAAQERWIQRGQEALKNLTNIK